MTATAEELRAEIERLDDALSRVHWADHFARMLLIGKISALHRALSALIAREEKGG